MLKIPVSKFKATCAAVLDEVERTGRPVVVTRRGKPIAEISRSAPAKSVADLLGCMAGEIEIEAEWLKNWDEIEAKGPGHRPP